MKLITINIIILLMSLLIACSNDKAIVESGDSLESVRTENISDVIRMPVSAVDSIDTTSVAKFSFDEKLFNFDTIYEGDIVEHTFSFTNSGKTPLLINDVRSPCGCTVPIWPKEAIAPGEKSQVVIKFDSKGKSGLQTKGVTLFANTYPNKTMLRVYGYVAARN